MYAEVLYQSNTVLMIKRDDPKRVRSERKTVLKQLNHYYPTSVLLSYGKADASLLSDVERWVRLNGAVTRTIKVGTQLPANFVRAAKVLLQQYLLDQYGIV